MFSNTLILVELAEIDHVFGGGEWPVTFGNTPLRHRATVEDAMSLLSERPADCILLSRENRENDDVDSLLEQVQNVAPGVPVIVTSMNMSAATAVRLSRAGAWNCFGPGDSAERLRDSMESAVEERRRTRKTEVQLNDRNDSWRRFLIGDSPAMNAVADTIRLVGPRRSTVLISGETGSGKEMAARAIHMASPRARLTMVTVNCGALPENLLEAELFGHTKGAFTGAANHRVGRFEQADKGTIFLDEIGEMPLELQAKLLRVLQERELQRLGSSETIKVDVRVIAATNVDLEARVRDGRFREDLYYRLNVVPVKMPPLRERASDIPALVAHLTKKVCQNEGIPMKRVSPEAMEQLCGNEWPGNVRQLENSIELAIVVSGERDVLNTRDFGLRLCKVIPISLRPSITAIPKGVGLGAAVDQFELEMMEKALEECEGNKTAAAERLGMKRTTLIMKMRHLRGGITQKAS